MKITRVFLVSHLLGSMRKANYIPKIFSNSLSKPSPPVPTSL